jgi:hypothetical protein
VVEIGPSGWGAGKIIELDRLAVPFTLDEGRPTTEGLRNASRDALTLELLGNRGGAG